MSPLSTLRLLLIASSPTTMHAQDRWLEGIATTPVPGRSVRLWFGPPTDEEARRLLAWQPHAIIAYAHPRMVEVFGHHPGVVFCHFHQPVDHPSAVILDDASVGHAAADHLRLLGHRRVLSLVLAGPLPPRMTAFAASGLALSDPLVWDDRAPAALRARLGRPSPPTALFCHNDAIALAAADVVVEVGLRIPQEVAVLGCDDLTRLVHLGVCPLSSVRVPHTELGRQAMRQALELVQGHPPRTTSIASDGVTVRHSTAVDHLEDALVREALALVRETPELGVEDLARRLHVSRRTLTTRCTAALGMGPREAIHRERLRQAQELLRTHPHLALAEVAVRCGFANRLALGRVFRRLCHTTPAAWRG